MIDRPDYGMDVPAGVNMAPRIVGWDHPMTFHLRILKLFPSFLVNSDWFQSAGDGIVLRSNSSAPILENSD